MFCFVLRSISYSMCGIVLLLSLGAEAECSQETAKKNDAKKSDVTPHSKDLDQFQHLVDQFSTMEDTYFHGLEKGSKREREQVVSGNSATLSKLRTRALAIKQLESRLSGDNLNMSLEKRKKLGQIEEKLHKCFLYTSLADADIKSTNIPSSPLELKKFLRNRQSNLNGIDSYNRK